MEQPEKEKSDRRITPAQASYEQAYKGIPKVTLVLSDQCAKCGTRVRVEGRVPEGVFWDPSLTCGRCRASWVVTVHIKTVETS